MSGMLDCIFCKIVAGEIPAAKVYEDDLVVAFLDIRPVSPGHTLIIPKAHHETLADTPNELLAHMMIKAKMFMQSIKEVTQADFVALTVVGVEVPHFHVHLVPRKYDDGLANSWPTMEYGEGEMEAVAEKIKNTLK